MPPLARLGRNTFSGVVEAALVRSSFERLSSMEMWFHTCCLQFDELLQEDTGRVHLGKVYTYSFLHLKLITLFTYPTTSTLEL
jgi:hypothetical protein